MASKLQGKLIGHSNYCYYMYHAISYLATHSCRVNRLVKCYTLASDVRLYACADSQRKQDREYNVIGRDVTEHTQARAIGPKLHQPGVNCHLQVTLWMLGQTLFAE